MKRKAVFDMVRHSYSTRVDPPMQGTPHGFVYHFASSAGRMLHHLFRDEAAEAGTSCAARAEAKPAMAKLYRLRGAPGGSSPFNAPVSTEEEVLDAALAEELLPLVHSIADHDLQRAPPPPRAHPLPPSLGGTTMAARATCVSEVQYRALCLDLLDCTEPGVPPPPPVNFNPPPLRMPPRYTLRIVSQRSPGFILGEIGFGYLVSPLLVEERDCLAQSMGYMCGLLQDHPFFSSETEGGEGLRARRAALEEALRASVPGQIAVERIRLTEEVAEARRCLEEGQAASRNAGEAARRQEEADQAAAEVEARQWEAELARVVAQQEQGPSEWMRVNAARACDAMEESLRVQRQTLEEGGEAGRARLAAVVGECEARRVASAHATEASLSELVERVARVEGAQAAVEAKGADALLEDALLRIMPDVDAYLKRFAPFVGWTNPQQRNRVARLLHGWMTHHTVMVEGQLVLHERFQRALDETAQRKRRRANEEEDAARRESSVATTTPPY
jgi:hypothetical protein